ncbi:MAG TPA: glycosyltransferase family 9 protein [Acidobacteriaceae bacterium]|nr:glycosyltransferase family 9 protein [Acidobacteriaceae bacterium]
MSPPKNTAHDPNSRRPRRTCYPEAIANALKSAALINLGIFERLLHPRQPDLADITNFLLLQYPLALGTAIHATPLIAAIHATIPGARVAAAASGFALEILRNNPGLQDQGIARLIPTPTPLRELLPAANAIRRANPFGRERYAVLLTTGNERSRVILSALLAGAPTRVGYTLLPELAAAHLHFDPRLSQIANNLRILEALGHGPALLDQLQSNPNLIEPQVFPSPDDTATAHQLLREQGIDESKPIAVFITQTSPTQRKSWREDRFRAVAETLHRTHKMQIVFAGTAAESPAIEALRSGLTFPTATVAGQTSLLELSAILGLADIALTLDTGPMHLARAMRLPMVIIAPAWSPAVEWLPLNNPRARILKNLDLPTAPDDYLIDEVTVPEVEQHLNELLTLYPPRTFTHRT